MDGITFTKKVLPRMGLNTFIYYDPPYIENGEGLYLNKYKVTDHHTLTECIAHIQQPWICTYDYAAVRHQLLLGHQFITYELPYTAQGRYEGKEVMFLSNSLRIPYSWSNQGRPAFLIRKRGGYTLMGTLCSYKPSASF